MLLHIVGLVIILVCISVLGAYAFGIYHIVT